MNDFNDYYTNDDNYSSYENYDKDVINNYGTNFNVSIMKKLYVALLLFVIIYTAIFCASIPLLIDLANSGLRQTTDLVIIFMVCLLLLVVFFFINSAGRKIEISGNIIHIRKWFIFNEETSIINVSHCDVITGLSSYNRYGMRIYNKAVVYYNSGKSVSVTDNTYLGWQQLVDYMNYNRKVVNIDGRSTFIKWFENIYDNHRNLF